MFIPDSYNHGISIPINWNLYFCQRCKKFYDFNKIPMNTYIKSRKPYQTISVCNPCMKELIKKDVKLYNTHKKIQRDLNGINKSNKQRKL